MSYEDILSGAEPLPAAAAGDPNLVNPGWLSDLTSAVSSVAAAALPAVGTYFQNNQAIKNAMSVAAARSGGPPNLRYPGLGYSQEQLTPYGAQPSNYVYMGPQGLQIGPGDMPGGGGGTMGGASGSWSPAVGGASGDMFRTSSAPHARAQRIIMGQNPTNGMVHLWYHIGSLDKIIREGLRACGYGRRRRRRGYRRPY